MDVETNYCTNEINNCLVGTQCPPDVGSTPIVCENIQFPQILNCQIQIGSSCKQCHEFYYLQKNKCLPCSDDCLTCYSTTVCGVCVMPDWMEPTYKGICKRNCPDLMNNQYCDDGVAKTCQSWLVTECKCGTHKFCASCSTWNECETCLPGYLQVGNECQQCKSGYIPFEDLCVKALFGGGGIPPVKPEPETPIIITSGVSIQLILGMIIGLVILILVVVGIVFYILKQRQKILLIDTKPVIVLDL